MANIGYIRVSSIDQNLERQEIKLQGENCQKIYRDKASGKNNDRPEFKAMMNYIRSGDTIIVTELSRLARNTRGLLQTVEDLKNKGVELRVLKEGIDTTTDTGKFMLTIFAAIAELERDSIRSRQREGIEIAKQKGLYKGRPASPLPKNWDDIIERWRKGEIKAVEAMKLTGVKKTRFYHLAKKT